MTPRREKGWHGAGGVEGSWQWMGKEKSSGRSGTLIHSEDHTPGPGSQTHPQPLGRIGRVEPPKLEPHTDVTAT